MLESLSLAMPLAQLHATTTVSGGGAPATNMAAPAVGVDAAATTQGTTLQAGTQEAPKPSSPFSSVMQFAPILIMVVLLYFIMFRGQKKTEKTRKQMLSQMKKGDEVMTIGGMVARVVSIDDDEVVLKIDESANVKARYKKSAIQQVITAEDKAK